MCTATSTPVHICYIIICLFAIPRADYIYIFFRFEFKFMYDKIVSGYEMKTTFLDILN